MTGEIAYSAAKHPAPHRERVGLLALFYGLFAAPIMWAGNFMVNYGVLSHACYPGSGPLETTSADRGFAWPLTLAFYVLTLVVCASGFVVAHRNWKATGEESEGHTHQLMEVGEGRTRYLGIIGMAFSALFFLTSAFGLLIYIFEPLCAFQ
jgi:hypothetical protein